MSTASISLPNLVELSIALCYHDCAATLVYPKSTCVHGTQGCISLLYTVINVQNAVGGIPKFGKLQFLSKGGGEH